MNTYLMYKELGKDSMYKIWHYTNRPMIIYTYSDGGSIVFADKLFPIKRGTLCFIGANRVHYTMPDPAEGYLRSKIFCSNERFENILNAVISSEQFINRFAKDSDVCAIVHEDDLAEVEKIFEDLNEASVNKQYADAYLASAIIKLLIYIDKYAASTVTAPNTFFSSAISYINSKINEKITVDEVAQICHMSKYYFCRRFKQTIGLTIMEYILKTRLANAKILLGTTSLTISEISERCGFSGFSYFSRIFKENYGITPNEFRKQGLIAESHTQNKD